ncbi:MAG: serine/threonine protein kinase [Planctomycetes bacterium]|nr:serine/threonine protein kinase [Planctomycetota bacterium]
MNAPSGSPAPDAPPGSAAPMRLPLPPSRPWQDLSGEAFLARAPRVRVEGCPGPVPCLGGIPLLARLGQGGMGAVYYGIHPRLDVEVAVKVLPPEWAERDAGLVSRFLREAKVAARIKSPHLVGVLDVNEERGLHYLTMEYVRGESAGSYLRRLHEQGQPGLPEALALDLVLAVTEGLGVAHREGVIHRDLKPDNILLPANAAGELDFGAAKVADLGLARSESYELSLTNNQTALGTPGYLAPEQATDAKSAGKAADVFSLGATLYALLAKRPPFTGNSLSKVLFETVHAPHPPLRPQRPDISDTTLMAINRCLAKDPAGRYPDAAALRAALHEARARLSGAGSAPATPLPKTLVSPSTGMQGPTMTTPYPYPTEPQPPKRNVAVLVLLGGLAAILLVVLGAVGVYYGLGSLRKPNQAARRPNPAPQPAPAPDPEPVLDPPPPAPAPTPPAVVDPNTLVGAAPKRPDPAAPAPVAEAPPPDPSPERLMEHRKAILARAKAGDLSAVAAMVEHLMWDEMGTFTQAEIQALLPWGRSTDRIGSMTAPQLYAILAANWVVRQPEYPPEKLKELLTATRQALAAHPMDHPILLSEAGWLFGAAEPPDQERKEQCIRKALELLEAEPLETFTPWQQAARVYQHGVCLCPEYNAMGDWSRATRWFADAALRAGKVGDSALQGLALYNQARSLQPDVNPTGDWGQALALYVKSARAYESAGDLVAQASSLRQYAWCLQPDHNPGGDWSRAAEVYAAAAALYEKLNRPVDHALSLSDQGYCLSPQRNPRGNWEQTAKLYTQAVSLYSSRGRKLDMAICLHEQAYHLVKGQSENLTPAIQELFRRSAVLRREAGDEEGAKVSETWLK